MGTYKKTLHKIMKYLILSVRNITDKDVKFFFVAQNMLLLIVTPIHDAKLCGLIKFGSLLRCSNCNQSLATDATDTVVMRCGEQVQVSTGHHCLSWSLTLDQ